MRSFSERDDFVKQLRLEEQLFALTLKETELDTSIRSTRALLQSQLERLTQTKNRGN